MNKQYFGCAGCNEPGGSDGDTNYCSTCETYKYFSWIDCECGDCDEHE
jgi:hypothetical protein